jgi:hypothetical protein
VSNLAKFDCRTSESILEYHFCIGLSIACPRTISYFSHNIVAFKILVLSWVYIEVEAIMSKVVRTTITIKEDLLEQFKIYSESQHRSVSAQISAMIESALKRDVEKQ